MESKIEVKKEKKYKNYDQNSVVHLPVLLSDLVKDNVLVHLVNELVEKIEMDSLNEYYADGGRPPYHPRMMIKVWIYAYCSKVYTSRKLAKKLREDVGFMWLSGMQQPCFKTLSDFRGNRMKDLIEVVFKEVLCYLVLNNHIDLNDLYVDGSKWEANNNKHKRVWKKNTLRYKESVLARIDELFKEVEELQGIEDLRYGKNDLNEVKSPEEIHVILNSEQLSEQLIKVNELVEQESEKKRKRKLNSLSNRLEKEGAKLEKYEEQEEVLDWRNSYGQTDEDATMMRMKDDLLRPGYNTEITTSNQYIVNPTVHQNGTDSPTFIPHVEQLKKRVKGLVGSDWSPDMTTDAGYGSEEIYDYAKAEKMRAFIKYFSWYEEYTGALSKKPFRKENWYYDEAENYFLCPNEKKLIYKETRETTTTNGYVKRVEVYECESCLDCPLFKKCRHDKAKPDSNRTIQFSKKLEAFKKEVKALLASEEGLKKRSKRGTEVETPFGNMKYNMGHRRFVLRSLEKVSIEFTLLAIAHNIRKIYCEKTGIWEEFYAQRAAKREEKLKKRV